MKLRHLLPLFSMGALLLGGITVLFTARLMEALKGVTQVEDRRFESILLADELRQSSDDLTKFARMFVQTGDERFMEYFQKVLAIRNGKVHRPDGYEGIFWDHVAAGNDDLLTTGSGETISFQDRMVLLGFSEKEFSLLAEAQKRSDALTKIENRAFGAIRGLYYDEATGMYTLAGPKNMKLAQSLLYDMNYLKAKASIMEPIGQFQKEVNARTARALTIVRKTADRLLIGTIVSTVSLLGFLVMFSILIYRKVLVRSSLLAETAEQISAGNLAVRSGVRGIDELGVLGTTFDHMVSRLVETLALVEAAKARMEEELNLGRDLQKSLLPHIFPAYPDRKEMDLFAVLEPAKETSGDFFDFLMIDEHRLYFAIADVSGKGVPAALFMAMTKIMLKARVAVDPSPASIVTYVNDAISADNDNCMFVTLYLGILNLRDGTLRTTNAGHNFPLLRRRGGQFEWLTAKDGQFAGPTAGVAYKETKTQLAPGDEIFLYTDGVTEAHNVRRELFGDDRLKAVLDQSTSSSVTDRIQDVMKAVKTFAGDAPQADDITMLALRYNGVTLSDASAAVFRQTMPNQLTAIPTVQTAFAQYISQWARAKPLIPKFNLALDDLLNNVVQYAFPNDPTEHHIEVEGEVRGEWIVLTITDDGIPFNPLTVEAPDLSLPLHEREMGGLGVHLVRSMFDEVSYHRTVGHNALTVKKKLPS